MKAIHRTPGISFPLSPLEIHLCNKQHYENSEFLNLKTAFFQKKVAYFLTYSALSVCSQTNILLIKNEHISKAKSCFSVKSSK